MEDLSSGPGTAVLGPSSVSPAEQGNPSLGLSADDYNAALLGSLGVMRDDPTKPAASHQSPPVASFWEKLLHGVTGKSRTVELTRSIARGVSNATLETLKTISEGAAYVDRKTGLGELIQPGFNDQYDAEGNRSLVEGVFAPTIQIENHYLGKRSDDPLASFTEDASQFMSGWLATGRLSSLAGLAGKAGTMANLARGAVIDATAFDPQQASFAELLARAPKWLGGGLGKLLTVDGDDSQLVARLKRGAAGVIPGAILDGLIASARTLRGVKNLGPDAVPEAVEQVAADAATVEAVADGSHVPSAESPAHVTVDAENRIVHRDGIATEHSPAFEDRTEAVQQAESINAALDAHTTAGTIDESAVEQTAQHLEDALAGDEQALESFVDAPATLGVSYQTPAEDAVALTKQLSETFQRKIDAAIQARGQVSVQESMDMALEALTGVPERSALDVVKGGLKQAEGISGWKAATEQMSKLYQTAIIRLHSVVEARPHDPVAMDELRTAMQNYFDLRDAYSSANSDVARALRLGRERGTASISGDVRFADEASAEVQEARQAINEAREAVEQAKAEAPEAGKTRKGKRATADDGDARKPRKNRTNTDASSASSFQLARQRNRVLAALKKLDIGDIEFEHDPELAKRTAQRINDAADAQRADPIALTTEQEAAAKAVKTTTRNPIDDLSKLLDRAERELDRALKASREGPKAPKGPKPKPEVDPVTAFKKSAPKRSMDTSKMTPEQVQAVGRLFAMSSEPLRDAAAISAAAQVVKKGGAWNKVLELYTNNLLSGPVTSQTVAASGAILNVAESVFKVLGGIGSANRLLMREGIDQLAGLWKYLGENIRTAAMATRLGRSILDPAPQTIAFGGVTGRLIRAPGSVVGAAHELSKAAGYRSWIYAKSLRAGRALGLDGDALVQYADKNVRASVSPEGVALVPDALKYGQLVSLSTPLEHGSFTANLSRFTNSTTSAKFVLPFIKVSRNIFRYVWQSSPGLNLLNKQARAVILKGGEEAAALHARSAAATGLAAFAFHQALQDNLTGNGPTDPDARHMWLADHKPKSIRINGTWYSYARFEPFSKVLELAADAHDIATESESDTDGEEAIFGLVAALSSAAVSSAYMSGLSEFLDAWSSGQAHKVQRFVNGTAADLLVPHGVTMVFNTDPYYREARSLHDVLLSRLPGWSSTLDPRYTWAGEPLMKAPGVFNRNSLVQSKSAKASLVEDTMLELEHGLSPFPHRLPGTRLDLTDRERFDNGTRDTNGNPISPYRRLMTILRHGIDGHPSLRQEVEDLIRSPGWTTMSAGTPDFPGGEQLLRIQALKTRAELRALRQVYQEYPTLKGLVTAEKRAKKSAIRDGTLHTTAPSADDSSSVMDQYNRLFGTGVPK